MLQVRSTGTDGRHESARAIGSHPVAARLNTIDHERVVLWGGRRTQPTTSFLPKVVSRLQMQIEVPPRPLLIYSASMIDEHTLRVDLFRGCEFLLNDHGDETIRKQGHPRTFNSGALNADVRQSRCGIRSKARCFQGVVSVGEQAFNHLVPIVVAECEPRTAVSLDGHDYRDPRSFWRIRHRH